MKIRWIAAAVAALFVGSASAALAQDKMGDKKMDKKPAMQHKMQAAKGPVYVCRECKMYYTPAQAKKMHMKDPMGHMLTKKTKAPAGYKMGGAMDKMHDKSMNGNEKMHSGGTK